MNNYCRKCGEKLNIDDNYCPNCGQRIYKDKNFFSTIFIKNKNIKSIAIFLSIFIILVCIISFIVTNVKEKDSNYNSLDSKLMSSQSKEEIDTVVRIENTEAPIIYEVYITENGTKYHKDKNCSNMKYPSKVSIDYAISKGYTACKICFN